MCNKINNFRGDLTYSSAALQSLPKSFACVGTDISLANFEYMYFMSHDSCKKQTQALKLPKRLISCPEKIHWKKVHWFFVNIRQGAYFKGGYSSLWVSLILWTFPRMISMIQTRTSDDILFNFVNTSTGQYLCVLSIGISNTY